MGTNIMFPSTIRVVGQSATGKCRSWNI